MQIQLESAHVHPIFFYGTRGVVSSLPWFKNQGEYIQNRKEEGQARWISSAGFCSQVDQRR
jgi:hypothetical protein